MVDRNWSFLIYCCSPAAVIASCSRCAALANIVVSRPPLTMRRGEAFDKTAKLLGLGYPGGPAVEKLARDGDGAAVPLPRPLVGSADSNFSFAGLKSAVQRAVQSDAHRHEDIAASFQRAVIDCMIDRTARAMQVTRCADIGSRRRGCCEQRAARFACATCARSRSCVQRPARLAMHRQCSDDRVGRSGALRLWNGRRPRRARAGTLAARSGCRESQGSRG